MLFITQIVDTKDTTLGFVHDWIARLAKHEENIIVIALKTGDYNLPKNVTVYSLGKELGTNRLTKLVLLLRYVWLVRRQYTKVFVHMNQEYLVILGLYFRLAGKKVFFWRNHPKGNLLTYYAVFCSHKVFYTSPSSFTARFKNSLRMPAGVDLSLFGELPVGKRRKYSLLMIGRVSPIKHIELGILTLKKLHDLGIHASLDVVGDTPVIDTAYKTELVALTKEKELETHVRFLPGVAKEELKAVYNTYEIALNLTDTGSFDKTIVEAASCGTIPLTSNSSLQSFLPKSCVTTATVDALVERIQHFFEVKNRLEILEALHVFARQQSLDALIGRLEEELV